MIGIEGYVVLAPFDVNRGKEPFCIENRSVFVGKRLCLRAFSIMEPSVFELVGSE